ncbi:SEC7-like domain containing protein [Rhodotorula toruloides]|uniref:SEC7-like domain containing protein n=1 Tax=Rhodotorula toruloides TaxID=5286 RepID=A0A511KK91_RHOTO|nr:SEC7-like domain containing protein [Rhodotorula toruloides]
MPAAANPVRSESYNSVNTIGSAGANGGKGRLSISTISTGSYVHVPFPPVENKPATHPPLSSSSIAGFDFSPLRKRVSSSESVEGKMSIAGTMRRTSRFFRKLGGVASGASSKSTPSSPLPQGDFFMRSTESTPLPPVPSPLTRSPAAKQNSSPRQIAVARDPRVNRRDIPQLPSTSHLPGSPTGTSSSAMLRDESNSTLLSIQSRSSAGSGSRRRSLSLNSVRIDGGGAEGGLAIPRQPERARRPSSRTEDDRLRRELRRWRLGVDGVLGTASSSTTPSPSSFGGSPSLASQSSPQLERTASNLSADARPPSSSLSLGAELRRASVPGDTNKPLPPLTVYRSASLPTTSLAPPVLAIATQRSPSSEGDTPEIRLFSPSRSGSVSSAVTVNPADLARGSLTRGSVSSDASTEDGTGVGLGLATINETLHSRDNTLVSPTAETAATPARATFPTSADSPKRLSPSSAPATVSNRSKGDRGSIVALDSSLPASLAASSVSLSSSMGPGGSRAKSRRAKAAEAAAEEAMTDEEVDEKARGLATRAWEEDETFLEKRKIAEWLGTAGRLHSAVLRHYIDRFDFSGLRLDLAFRKLCGKLYLKAETQQVDRILEQFSRRYFADNPSSPYGSLDVVHAVSYSLLLLNTDLHVVDSTTRMSRQQFIRNTLDAISAQTGSPNPDAPLASPSDLVDAPPPLPDTSALTGICDRPSTAETVVGTTGTGIAKDPPAPVSIPLPASPASSGPATANSLDRPTRTVINAPHRSESTVTVSSSQSNKTLDVSLQAVLKDMYNAVRAQPIYQASLDSASQLNLPELGGRPSISLSPLNSPYATWSSGVNRSMSRRSSQSTISGVSSMAYKRSSVRGIGSFLGASSLELVRSSSPTSSATSLTDERWNTAYGPSSQHHAVPTIGFANSLSNTIIREQREDDNASEASTIEVTDEELALLGAPWAKEGILQRKHYWEMTGKRAKDKSWSQVFVVISAGELKMFRFDGSGGSMRAGGGIGGGDWTASASNAGSISLIHALCSSMPPSGYSRDRPHCFVLTLPNGGSYFFQAGTPDLVVEWVSACNYWAARLSKEPLRGGVSNMEYGWNRVDRLKNDDEREEIASIRSGHSRISYASSAFHSATSLSNSNDRIHINEWNAPEIPLVPTNLPEEAQLEALKCHAALVRNELHEHNWVRQPMLQLYSPRSSNAARAQANWERKSKHLLAENVKYNTYIDALASAIKLRALQRGKKEVEAMLESADAEADDEDELIASLSPSDGPASPTTTAKSTPPSPEITFSPAISETAPEPASRRQSRYDSASQMSDATGRTEFFDSHGDSPPPSTP